MISPSRINFAQQSGAADLIKEKYIKKIDELCKKHNVTYEIVLDDMIFSGASVAFEKELIQLLEIR